MTYLTFEEYQAYGGKAEQSAFPRLERKARKKLDSFTQDRLVNATVIPDTVKECMTEFVDLMTDMEGEKVSSFSNGSVSVSFQQDDKTDDEKMWNIAVEYLPIELISMVVENETE